MKIINQRQALIWIKSSLKFSIFMQFDIQIINWCTISRKLRIAVVPQNSNEKLIQTDSAINIKLILLIILVVCKSFTFLRWKYTLKCKPFACVASKREYGRFISKLTTKVARLYTRNLQTQSYTLFAPLWKPVMDFSDRFFNKPTYFYVFI